MKKIFFTAMACTAFAFNGLASNEVNYIGIENNSLLNETNKVNYRDPIVSKFTCTVNVVMDDGYGGTITLTHVETYYFVTESAGTSKCNDFRDRTEAAYKELIFSPR